MLENLGFVWDARGDLWQQQYENLVSFRAKHGHCKVPFNVPEWTGLGQWVNRQRTLFSTGRLSDEKVRKLERLGFVWNTRDVAWQDFFAELVAYEAETGHCNVPKRSPDYPKLANWVANQRAKWRRGTLPENRLIQLEAIGFEWQPKR